MGHNIILCAIACTALVCFSYSTLAIMYIYKLYNGVCVCVCIVNFTAEANVN